MKKFLFPFAVAATLTLTAFTVKCFANWCIYAFGRSKNEGYFR